MQLQALRQLQSKLDVKQKKIEHLEEVNERIR
jgi:hypothetical protein